MVKKRFLMVKKNYKYFLDYLYNDFTIIYYNTIWDKVSADIKKQFDS